jgi:hypothetical protein
MLSFLDSPSTAQHGDTFVTQPIVQVLDEYGNVVNSTASITLAIAAATPSAGGPGTLVGTATKDAVAGDAAFSGLSIRGVGTGYQLTATSSGLIAAASAEFDVTPREITVTAAGATMAYSGFVICAAPTAGSCTPTVTSAKGLVGSSTWTMLTESFDSALPGNGRTLTPTAVVSDAANYAITLVPTADGIITGSIITAPGAWNLGTTYRGETVASATGQLSWISYETNLKRVTAEMTVPLCTNWQVSPPTCLGSTIDASNVTLWSTDGANDTSLGTLGAKRTVKNIAQNTNVTDSAAVFIKVSIPMDAALASYAGTITYTIENR